jgi:hypothetical protein
MINIFNRQCWLCRIYHYINSMINNFNCIKLEHYIYIFYLFSKIDQITSFILIFFFYVPYYISIILTVILRPATIISNITLFFFIQKFMYLNYNTKPIQFLFNKYKKNAILLIFVAGECTNYINFYH